MIVFRHETLVVPRFPFPSVIRFLSIFSRESSWCPHRTGKVYTGSRNCCSIAATNKHSDGVVKVARPWTETRRNEKLLAQVFYRFVYFDRSLVKRLECDNLFKLLEFSGFSLSSTRELTRIHCYLLHYCILVRILYSDNWILVSWKKDYGFNMSDSVMLIITFNYSNHSQIYRRRLRYNVK